MRSFFAGFGVLGLVLAGACGAAGEEDVAEGGEDAYTTEGTCDGLPKLKRLVTPPGVCVGVVAQGLTFARGIAQLPSGDFVLAEMGGWAQDRGAVWLLRRMPDKTYSKTRVAKLIDKPSTVAVGPDGLPYIGTPKGVFRFDPYEQTVDPVPRSGPFRASPDYKQPRLKVVINDLPGKGRHPLAKIVFAKNDPWTLYANVGSASDVCESGANVRPPAGYPLPCAEADVHGVIRKYLLAGPDHTANGFTVMARGLRNSMALAVHPTSGALVQGENSRDSINKHDATLAEKEGDLPHEEINVIVEGADYGWPYCYDDGAPNPEYRGRVDCARFQAPALLLPGHAAPLGMAYYTGALFPAPYKGNLLVGYHGYRANGHRLALVAVDPNGIPTGAEPLDVIRGWEKSADGRDPLGSPVDVLVAKDGSIYVTEDKNGDVLRVFFDPARGNGQPMPALASAADGTTTCPEPPASSHPFAAVQRDVLRGCVGCHGAATGNAGRLVLDCDMVKNAKRLRGLEGPMAFVKPNDMSASTLVQRFRGVGGPQMPAGGISNEQMDKVEAWIMSGATVPPQ